MSPLDLLHRHVDRFNEGVRTGDADVMASCFADDAELVFEGVAAGPYRGRDAIVAAYRDRPPTDEIVLLDPEWDDVHGVATARYAWGAAPDVTAGDLRLTPDGDRIARLVVTV